MACGPINIYVSVCVFVDLKVTQNERKRETSSGVKVDYIGHIWIVEIEYQNPFQLHTLHFSLSQEKQAEANLGAFFLANVQFSLVHFSLVA